MSKYKKTHNFIEHCLFEFEPIDPIFKTSFLLNIFTYAFCFCFKDPPENSSIPPTRKREFRSCGTGPENDPSSKIMKRSESSAPFAIQSTSTCVDSSVCYPEQDPRTTAGQRSARLDSDTFISSDSEVNGVQNGSKDRGRYIILSQKRTFISSMAILLLNMFLGETIEMSTDVMVSS